MCTQNDRMMAIVREFEYVDSIEFSKFCFNGGVNECMNVRYLMSPESPLLNNSTFYHIPKMHELKRRKILCSLH
jgi:hypothetical protein